MLFSQKYFKSHSGRGAEGGGEGELVGCQYNLRSWFSCRSLALRHGSCILFTINRHGCIHYVGTRMFKEF